MTEVEQQQHGVRNARLYPWYSVAQNAYFWMPVFFLYFSQKVPLREVLWLEAVYYTAVVVLEVPSGYASDRFGRRPTLLLSSLSLVLAYVLFVLGDSFAALALAQVLLAAGIAFNSGTDTSFHLDSLAMCNQADEYGAREARISQWSFWSTAGAAILGGAAGLWDIRAAYGLSGLAALVALVVSWFFVEPLSRTEPGHGQATTSSGFVQQLIQCLKQASTAPLRWLMAVAVVATIINHIPYEFYQPYLDLIAQDLQGTWLVPGTPLLAGFHMGITFLVAGWAGGQSIALADRLGTRRLLVLSLAVQLMLIAAMGLWLGPLVAVLIMLRSVPGSLQRAPLNREVAPRLPSHLRATYLSLQSLAGRLGFTVTLVSMSWIASGDTHATWDELSTIIRTMVLCFVLVWGVLWLWKEPLENTRHE